MANTIKSRVLLKTDITANWEKATNFIPKVGEVCIYSDRFQLDDGTYVPGIKVGDGTSYISELEFMGDEYITNEEINALLDFNGSDEPSGGTIPLVTLTFPLLDQDILNMGDIDSKDVFYFSTLSSEGNIIMEQRYFWDVCLYEDKRTIQVLPYTLLYCSRLHWSSFDNKDVRVINNGYAIYITKNTVLEWDGPT